MEQLTLTVSGANFRSIKKRTMKYIASVIFLILTFIPFSGKAQSDFSKFENSDKVGTVSLNKGVFSLVSLIDVDKQDEETKEFMDLVRNIDKLNVYMTKDANATVDMIATAKQYVKKGRMEKLMRVKDDGSQVDFYIKEGKDDDHVSELLMTVTGMEQKKSDAGFETIILTMTGDIDLTKVGSLASKLDLPKDLEKAEKKK